MSRPRDARRTPRAGVKSRDRSAVRRYMGEATLGGADNNFARANSVNMTNYRRVRASQNPPHRGHPRRA